MCDWIFLVSFYSNQAFCGVFSWVQKSLLGVSVLQRHKPHLLLKYYQCIGNDSSKTHQNSAWWFAWTAHGSIELLYYIIYYIL